MKTHCKYAETYFLSVLITKYGGMGKFAKLINKDYFQVNNWKCRGYIPYKVLGSVSALLGITPLVLNNRVLTSLGYTDWKKQISKLSVLSKKDIEKILSLPNKFK